MLFRIFIKLKPLIILFIKLGLFYSYFLSCIIYIDSVLLIADERESNSHASSAEGIAGRSVQDCPAWDDDIALASSSGQ